MRDRVPVTVGGRPAAATTDSATAEQSLLCRSLRARPPAGCLACRPACVLPGWTTLCMRVRASRSIRRSSVKCALLTLPSRSW